LGLLAGIELRLPNGRPTTSLALDVIKAMLCQGYILLPEGEHSNIISLAPPLTISASQLKAAVRALFVVLRAPDDALLR
jgi:4-aminobutyrate aminotransferase-like enzyme